MKDRAGIRDNIFAALSARRGGIDRARIVGHGIYELIGPDGEVKLRGTFQNLVTDYGDQYYAERASASPATLATGMRLGTGGATAAAKNGAGASIVTYVTGSARALDSNPATSDLGAGSGYRVQYVVTWPAGVATANGIDEATVANDAGPSDDAGVAGETLSRAVLAPVVNKGASDQLVITWNHDLLGA